MHQVFASGGQSIGPSASASVLPKNIQDWFSLYWLAGSPCSSRDSQGSSPTPQFKSINSLALSFLYSRTLISVHDYWKNHSLTRHTLISKVMYLLFNMLSRLVIAFLPRSKCLIFMATVTICSDVRVQENKSLSLFPLFSHLIAMKWWDWMPS